MARYIGPVCRLCRREGEKLFLKGERCFTPKCAVDRRDGVPGQHSKNRGQFSEFKQQLREKQKVKRMYGLLEKQFRLTFKEADRLKGVTGENLLKLLESRLDNMVYRAGFAASRKEARQLVNHCHFVVNGIPVKTASLVLKAGDMVSLRETSKELPRLRECMMNAESRKIVDWISVNKDSLSFSVRALPGREQLTHPIKEQLIVELYSR